MVRALAALERGQISEQAQTGDGATYAKKISKDEAHIDWSKSAGEIDCSIRGLSPWPGAWSEVKGERLKILDAEPVNSGGESIMESALSRRSGDRLRRRRLAVTEEYSVPVAAAMDALAICSRASLCRPAQSFP